MRRFVMFATALSMTMTVPSFAEDVVPKPAGDAAPMMTVDRDSFLKQVSSSNEFEIQSSELASQKAADAKLKEAAAMIVADHKKAGEKLKMTLETKGATAPAPMLSPKHKKMIEQLNAAASADFDALYLDMQAQAHMEAVGLFRTYAGGGDDYELMGFAKETLPTLETHLAHVKMLVMHQH